MPKYYFHLEDRIPALDEDGCELPGPEAAKREAARLVGRSLLDDPAAFWSGDGWSLVCADETGLSLFAIRVSAPNTPPAKGSSTATEALPA